MPKKFKGENSKATVAKARKAAVHEEAARRKQEAAENEYWRDDDKQTQRKQQRKEEREKKRLDDLQRKKETDELLQTETASIKAAKPEPVGKLTRADIASAREREAAAAARTSRQVSVNDEPLEENPNLALGAEGEARSVGDAISLLSVKEPAMDRHPERRMKAAYQDYEDVNLPILKAENPNLRLSQLKQMLKKDWMKSPENPMNQRHASYNAKKK